MERIAPTQLESDCLRQLYAYWREKQRARGGALPRRSDIDPLELPTLVLPHILLAERLASPAGPRWRYRLVGTAVVEAAGLDPTWGFLDEILPGGYGAYVLELYDTLFRLRRPIYSESVYRAPGRPDAAERITRRLMLPLAGEADSPGGAQQAVDYVLSGQVFESLTRLPSRGVLDDGPFSAGIVALVLEAGESEDNPA